MVVEWKSIATVGNIIVTSNIVRLRLKKWTVLSKGLGLEMVYRKYRDDTNSLDKHIFMMNIENIEIFISRMYSSFDSIPSKAKIIYFKEVDINIKYEIYILII